MQHINLETFANGAFTAQVNRAIEEVTKNIQDPNTDATAARKITVFRLDSSQIRIVHLPQSEYSQKRHWHLPLERLQQFRWQKTL